MSETFLRDMIVASKLSVRDLNRVIETAPKRYKVYTIPKRSGGTRTIAHPSRELKVLQNLISEKILSNLPVHCKAAAYVKGIGIRQNAEAHVGKRYLLKMDFENFFPSIKVSDWNKYVSRKDCKIKFDVDDQFALERLMFWGNGDRFPVCLSIGAPTSPALSNILMYKFDSKVCKTLRSMNVIYTRYADDITLSSDDIIQLRIAEKSIEYIVRLQRWPVLKLNNKKRGLFTKGVRQMVTGLVLTPEGSVSIGRDRNVLFTLWFSILRGGVLLLKTLRSCKVSLVLQLVASHYLSSL